MKKETIKSKMLYFASGNNIYLLEEINHLENRIKAEKDKNFKKALEKCQNEYIQVLLKEMQKVLEK